MFVAKALSGSLLFALSATAHTTVWSVWVNGVDQGSGSGIRTPGYAGSPAEGGYNDSPIRNLSSFEMSCNVLGDRQSPDTISVYPSDIVTLEWHHNFRNASDDIIATSHVGSGQIYISPDPPTSSSWIKIQSEGNNTEWYPGVKLNERLGKQDFVIPPGLAQGYYLVRGELLALHEADVAWSSNENRGIQIYADCIQVEVLGSGNVTLPSDGVGFPGVYNDSSTGIVYNIYLTTSTDMYTAPGPTVWSGAMPSPSPPDYGTTKGYTTAENWSTWIGSAFTNSATLGTMVTTDLGTTTVAQPYFPSWSSAYHTPTSVSSIPLRTMLPPSSTGSIDHELPTVTARPGPSR